MAVECACNTSLIEAGKRLDLHGTSVHPIIYSAQSNEDKNKELLIWHKRKDRQQKKNKKPAAAAAKANKFKQNEKFSVAI